MFIRYLMILFPLIFIFGCASTNTLPTPEDYAHYFADDAFKKPLDIQQTEDVYYLSPTQKRWLNTLIKPHDNSPLTHQLINGLFKENYLGFHYDNSFTRTAEKTLESKQGNCLSMVIMSVAIAKHLNIRYKIYDIEASPVWNKNGGIFLLNGHVNVQLENTSRSPKAANELIRDRYITLDFFPEASSRKSSKERISERKLVAMYFSNLAADAMVKKQWNKAYWLLKESISNSPEHVVAWNSLGVVYRNAQQYDLAEKVYKYVLDIKPNDLNVITNLAILLSNQGRKSELEQYQHQLRIAQLKNPYPYFDKAQVAYQEKSYKKAIKFYKKAINLSPFVDEFYFGLYKTYAAMNKMTLAKKYLKYAQDNSANFVDRRRYGNKLAILAKNL